MTDVSPVREHAIASLAPSGGPTRGSEPVFAEPWEGRAFALAVETVSRLDLPWDAFRERLMAAIADDPDRPYYESWLAALERLVLDHHAAEPEDLSKNRMEAASYRVDEVGNGDLEIFPVAVTEAGLRNVLERLFTHWWPHLRPPGHPIEPTLARLRLCAYAELARVWVDGAPRSWMFRMYNGAGEQQLSVLLPNPFLDDGQNPLPEPDWARLACWDELRRRLLDLDPDPCDRSGARFVHP